MNGLLLCNYTGAQEDIETIEVQKKALHIFPPDGSMAYSYKGDYNREGKMHGQGTMTWDEEGTCCPSMKDVSTYSGQWEAGKAHGVGTYTHPNGVIYEGQWLNGKANGEGTYTRPSVVTKPLQVGARVIAWHKAGGRRAAQVKEVLPNGKYVLSWDDGNTQDLQKTAADMTLEETEMVYTGQWVEDRQTGEGGEVWKDPSSGKESRYEGEYLDGKKHGHGKVMWSNGDSYEGQFENDVIHGHGRYKWKDGRMYDGGWANNERMGSGKFDWPNGVSYEGEYINNKRYGEGTYRFQDGREYNGQWHDGKQQGSGCYKSFLGDVRRGNFENNHHTKWTDGGEENNLEPDIEVPPMQV